MMTYTNSLLTKPPFWRCRAIATAILLALLILQPVRRTVFVGKAVADSPDVPATIDLLWKQSVNPAVFVTTSSDGQFVAIVSNVGEVTCFGANGKLIWQAELPGVDRVVVGPDSTAMAYSYLDLLDSKVYFIGSTGRIMWHDEVSGAVWCADASTTAGTFALGTGERYCYRYRVTGHSHRYKRWRLEGAPCSLNFCNDGKSLICGTWQDSGVAAYSVDGSRLAYEAGKEDRLYSLESASKDNRAVLVSVPNVNRPEGTVSLKDSDLNDLWSQDFRVQKLVSDISPTGDLVAVGFERSIAHKDKQAMEDRIALYDESGSKLWEKGGLFGKWDLLEMTSSGHILVGDESGHIFCLGRSGSILLRRKLPAAIHLIAKVPSRDKLVVYCGNGQLMFFSVR